MLLGIQWFRLCLRRRHSNQGKYQTEHETRQLFGDNRLQGLTAKHRMEKALQLRNLSSALVIEMAEELVEVPWLAPMWDSKLWVKA